MFKVLCYAMLGVLFMAMFGCAGASYKASSDFGTKMAPVKKVGIVVPSVVVNTAGFGDPVIDVDRSEKGKASVEAATLKAFKEHGFECVILTPSASNLSAQEQLMFLNEQNALFDRTAYEKKGPLTPIRVSKGDLSALQQIYERTGVDAIAVVTATDNNLSGGRIAANVLTNVVTIPFGVVISASGKSYETLILLTKDGDRIFQDQKARTSKWFHMENPSDAEDFVKDLVSDIPEAAKQKI